jgi:hypothetical protein
VREEIVYALIGEAKAPMVKPGKLVEVQVLREGVDS